MWVLIYREEILISLEHPILMIHNTYTSPWHFEQYVFSTYAQVEVLTSEFCVYFQVINYNVLPFLFTETRGWPDFFQPWVRIWCGFCDGACDEKFPRCDRLTAGSILHQVSVPCALLHTKERRAVRRRLLHVSTLCLITYQRKIGSQKKTITRKYLVPYYIPKKDGQSEEDYYT